MKRETRPASVSLSTALQIVAEARGVEYASRVACDLIALTLIRKGQHHGLGRVAYWARYLTAVERMARS
jgi:hypothetical protein